MALWEHIQYFQHSVIYTQLKGVTNAKDLATGFAKCSRENGIACAKCGSTSHETLQCNNPGNKGCINCHRAGVNQTNSPHSADSTACPCLTDYRNKFCSGSVISSNINWQSSNQQQTGQSNSAIHLGYHGSYIASHQPYNNAGPSYHMQPIPQMFALNNTIPGYTSNAPLSQSSIQHPLQQQPNIHQSVSLN